MKARTRDRIAALEKQNEELSRTMADLRRRITELEAENMRLRVIQPATPWPPETPPWERSPWAQPHDSFWKGGNPNLKEYWGALPTVTGEGS